jgi:hypothetical protein
MTELRFAQPTKRSHMSKSRAARIFFRCDGKCGICGLDIRGEYEIEHPDPLWAGGSDDDERLYPVHLKCHAPKTAVEAGQRAKRNRIVAAGYVGNRKPKSRFKRKVNGQVVLRSQE